MPDELKIYTPFQKIPEVYEEDTSGLMQERMLMAFHSAFGVGKNAVSSKFREKMTEVFDAEHPNLRCSVARALFEGRIPGIPKPLSYIPSAWVYRIKYALHLLDLFETMGALYIEDKIGELDQTLRGQAEAVRSSLGGLKVPRLMEEVSKSDERVVSKQVQTRKRRNRRSR